MHIRKHYFSVKTNKLQYNKTPTVQYLCTEWGGVFFIIFMEES